MNKIKTCLKVAVLCITSTYVHAQCEVFKSEISDVQHYMQQVSQLSDSLSTSAEIAAFDESKKEHQNCNAFNGTSGECCG